MKRLLLLAAILAAITIPASAEFPVNKVLEIAGIQIVLRPSGTDKTDIFIGSATQQTSAVSVTVMKTGLGGPTSPVPYSESFLVRAVRRDPTARWIRPPTQLNLPDGFVQITRVTCWGTPDQIIWISVDEFSTINTATFHR
jgi:virulence-associated protein VagC